MTQIHNQPATGGNTTAKFEVQDIYCQVDGQRIHYQVAGPEHAPVLVLVHGVGGSVNWWQHNLPTFSRHYHTYALDLPGFGRSRRLAGAFSIARGAQFVQDWLDFAGLQKINLLGHSMGGQISLRLAAQHPERVEKLVLAAPSGLWLTVQDRLRWLRDMPKVRVPLEQTLTIATGTMRTDAIAFAASLLAIVGDKEVEQNLAQLITPTLLLWGTADGIVPPALGPLMLEKIVKAKARLEYVERGTHNLMYDQSERFNQLTLAFLEEK